MMFVDMDLQNISPANALKDVRDPPAGITSTHTRPPTTTNDDAPALDANHLIGTSLPSASQPRCFTAAAL